MKPRAILTATLFCASLFFPRIPAIAGDLSQARPDTLAPKEKKPLLTTMVSSGEPVILRVLNDSGLRNFTNIVLDWELRANGVTRQKGSLTNLPITPGRPALVRLPVRIPFAATEELFLGLRYHYRNKPATSQRKPPPSQSTPTLAQGPLLPSPGAAALSQGRILAEEVFPLKPWTGSQLLIRPAGELSFSDENGMFTVQSPVVVLRFDKQTGWLQQYTFKDNSLLDTPGLKARFWLDPADPGYSADGAAGVTAWKEAAQSPRLQLFSTSTGSQLVIVRAEYTLPETACLLHLSYSINSAGEMLVEQSMEADSTSQGSPLPCFGMYWMLPAGFDSVTVYGMPPESSNTSHPPVPGIYHPTGVSTRETAGYSGVRWWKICNPEGKGLQVTADSTLLTISTRHTAALQINVDHPASPYQLPYGNYRSAWKLSPVQPKQ